jgi:hypothetical protein
MITPQYSVRGLLILVTASAALCLVLALAARGHVGAVAACVAIAGGVVMALVYGLSLAVTLALCQVVGRRNDRTGEAAKPNAL